MHYASIAADAPHGQYMTTEEAIAILCSTWTSNVRMWKYRGCQLGDDPRQWPHGILSSLAVLAQTAGTNNRIRAMQMISTAMGNLAYTAPTPQHIATATELLRQQKQRALSYPQQNHQIASRAAADACHAQEAVPLRSSAAATSAGSSLPDKVAGTGDEKESEVAVLRARIAKLKTDTDAQLQEKDKQIATAKMEWFNMDARLAVVTSDRDMYEMYCDVAEMHRKGLEKEKVKMDEALVVKDVIIDKLIRERDEAVGRASELEQELAALKGT